MLSNRYSQFIIALLFLFSIISCSDKQEKIPIIDYNNKTQLLDITTKHFDENIEIALGGMFDETGKKFIAVGSEINNSNEWGIKFDFLEKTGEEFVSKFETDLLEGSFKECFIDKIKISSFSYELVYYNSQAYFLGSGGGEVYSYIIDLENKLVYYAHLVVQPDESTYLFISDNTKRKDLVNFFTFTFKKDYPNLKLVSDDIIID